MYTSFLDVKSNTAVKIGILAPSSMYAGIDGTSSERLEKLRRLGSSESAIPVVEYTAYWK